MIVTDPNLKSDFITKQSVSRIRVGRAGKIMHFDFVIGPDLFKEADNLVAILKDAIVQIEKLKEENINMVASRLPLDKPIEAS